jgi:hypothetical protein
MAIRTWKSIIYIGVIVYLVSGFEWLSGKPQSHVE